MRRHLIIISLVLLFTLYQVRASEAVVPKCYSPTCSFDIQQNYYNLSCPCIGNEISARFTECNNGKKDLFFYWKPPAICYGSTLPEPVRDIPCDFKCDAGHFLDTDTISCKKCQPGTFSTGQQLFHINKWDDLLPPQMTTLCMLRDESGGPTCNKWKARGSFIDSGDNKGSKNTLSVLDYAVEVFEDSVVNFTYKVSGEGEYFDFFYFSIDGMEQMRDWQQPTWKTVSFPLSKGFHLLRWAYQKDFSVDTGEDVAKISEIIITGTSNVITKCQECQPGYYSDSEMASECRPCPANTFSDKPGATGCQPCPPWTGSFEGSSSCTSIYPCNETDYYFKYSECDENNQRDKIAEWIEPVTCNRSHPLSVELPPPQKEQCPPVTCNSGQQLVDSKCSYCPEGYVSADGQTCTRCEAGKYSNLKAYYIDKFENLDGFKTGCIGLCTSGWRYAYDFIDSGVGNGISESYISFDVEIVEDEYIERRIVIDYQLMCQENTGALEVYADNTLMQYIHCGGCDSPKKQIVLSLTSGNHTIRLNYHSFVNVRTNYECGRAVVSKISIFGSTLGGATQCDNCQPGTASYAGSSKCDECPAGTFSYEASPTCFPCPRDKFSYARSSECLECGNGTYSDAGSPKCEWKYGECKTQLFFNNATHTYDWKELADILKDKPIFEQDFYSQLYLNLDGKPSTKNKCNEAFACEVYEGAFDAVERGSIIDITPYEDRLVLDLKPKSWYEIGSVVNLFCHTEMNTTYEASVKYDWMTGKYIFDITSVYGCPLCEESDWVAHEEPCKGGKQYTIWKTNIRCARGVVKENTYKDCSPLGEVEFQWWIIVVVVGVIGLIILTILLIAVVYWYKHRSLSHRFSRLIENQEGISHEKM